MQNEVITHSVYFNLKHPVGSEEEKQFLDKAMELSSITKVNGFSCLREISENNKFTLGLTMEFDSISDYEDYNNHPLHKKFVDKYWILEVEDYLEIDYKVLAI